MMKSWKWSLFQTMLVATFWLLAGTEIRADTSISKQEPYTRQCPPFNPPNGYSQLDCTLSGNTLTCTYSEYFRSYTQCFYGVVASQSDYLQINTGPDSIEFLNSAWVGSPDDICGRKNGTITECWTFTFSSSAAFLTLNTEWPDTDGDGIGNVVDWDDDNDGVPDNIDAAPLDAGNTSEVVLPMDGAYKGSLQGNSVNQF